MEATILKIICANQGAVGTDDLMYNLFPGESSNVSQVICNQNKFALCCPNGRPTVVVRTRLRLCRVKDCPGSCRGLHLCQFYLYKGSCGFSLLRRGCNFSHDLNSDHNQRVLRENELESLTLEELRTLLLQSDNTLLPAVCYDYNNGHGEFGRCQEGDACKRLHICEKSFKSECICYRNHDFNAPQTLRVLQEKGIPDTMFHSLKSAYVNKEALRFSGNTDGRGRGRGRGGNRRGRGRGSHDNQPRQTRDSSISDILENIDSVDLYGADGSSDGEASIASSEGGRQNEHPKTAFRGRGGNRGNRGNRGNSQQLPKTRSTSDIFDAANSEGANGSDAPNRRPRPVRDKTEICMFFVKGNCIHEDRCFKAHDKMPYRWEVKEGDQWTPMSENETIEKDYCDPKNTYSTSSQVVHFDTMTCGPNKVRRLSTVNSLLQPTYILTTEWLWYWQDEFGNWNQYAADTSKHRPSDIDSATLEQKFLDNDKDVVEFKAGSQTYSLSFQDMIQTNKQYGTPRIVSRRPRFVSAADVREKKVRKPPGQVSSTALPDYWDKTQIPAKGFSRIALKSTSDEFKEVETHFCRTMRGFDIISIERIQNKALWEVFQWQKNQMKTNNGGRTVMERKLFHGTDSKHIEAICLHNFDWRVCGVNGTAYGKGSYFARDARYSHDYTGNDDVKTMFISQVLVGDYTKGVSDYRRPPSKDDEGVNFFDSCVDDIMNPSIFVVFEKHQIYPEYLLQYKTAISEVDIFSTAPVSAQTPILQPVMPQQPVLSVVVPVLTSLPGSTLGFTLQPVLAQNSVQAPKPAVPLEIAPARKRRPAPKRVLASKLVKRAPAPKRGQPPQPVLTPKTPTVFSPVTAPKRVLASKLAKRKPPLKRQPVPKQVVASKLVKQASAPKRLPAPKQVQLPQPVLTQITSTVFNLVIATKGVQASKLIKQVLSRQPVTAPKAAPTLKPASTSKLAKRVLSRQSVTALTPVPAPKPPSTSKLAKRVLSRQSVTALTPAPKPVSTSKLAKRVLPQQSVTAPTPTPAPKPASTLKLAKRVLSRQSVTAPTPVRAPKPASTSKLAKQVLPRQSVTAPTPAPKPASTSKPAKQLQPRQSVTAPKSVPALKRAPTKAKSSQTTQRRKK